MTSKRTLEKAMIARNGKKWNTLPERQFKKFQEHYGLGLIQNVNLPFTDGVLHYDFQCDFLRPVDHPTLTYDVDFEVDGPHHDSDINHSKDLWKDDLKNKAGLKVVHIPAELTKRKWWKYLDGEIRKALLNPFGSVYISA